MQHYIALNPWHANPSSPWAVDTWKVYRVTKSQQRSLLKYGLTIWDKDGMPKLSGRGARLTTAKERRGKTHAFSAKQLNTPVG